MSWFPQIATGSIAQFPLQRTRRWRSIANQMESAERILLPDPAANQIQWKLEYRELSDAETANLTGLFAESQGTFGAFTFVDPMANLLAWSEDLSRPDWQTGLLHYANGATDPLGTQRAVSITNPSPGAQSIQQSVNIPGEYVTCFSAFVRDARGGTLILMRDGTQVIATAEPIWQRVFVSGTGVSGAEESTFSLTLNPGQTIDVWGLQLEAQPYPSRYRQTSTAFGIYEETYFANDELHITSTAVGLSLCEITLISRG